MSKVYHSSKSDEWGTPQALYDILNKRYKFVADLAANQSNYKHENYFSLERDALTTSWDFYRSDYVWCNPPYSNIKSFLKRVVGADQSCVFLIPVRSCTTWWHTYLPLFQEVIYLKGRLKFEGPDNKPSSSAPFPSCLWIRRYCFELEGGYTSSFLWDWRNEPNKMLRL